MARAMLGPSSMLASLDALDPFADRRGMIDDLLAELRRRAAKEGDRRPVELIETHISWVLLGPEVYKIKKPVSLPFVDFTAFEDRERACRTEVRINRRLAPRTYLGVVPVRRHDGRFSFGGGGPVVEWAVRMKRLDERSRADNLLAAGALDGESVDRIAAALAAFHADSPSSPRIASFGSPEMIERNARDNFRAIREVALDVAPRVLDEIERWQIAYLRGRRDVFERRMVEGSIRDGHGDLRLEHVFFRGDDFEIIDGIEFDDRYRFGDVCADIAFLAMDLARLGHVDLAERLVASYARSASDYDLYGLLDFYESYRACVRAKITSNPAEARRYLLLAHSAQDRQVLQPALIVVAGTIASGKSTLANRLADELACPVIDADRTRKHMLGIAATAHATAGAFGGAYDKGFSKKVYAEVLRRAGVVLASGRAVIVDASFRSAAARADARSLATLHNVPFRFLECVAPLDVCRRRVEERARGLTVSDATPEILEAFAASFEPVTELPETEHQRIDTSGAVDPLEQARELVATWPRGLA